MMLVSSSTSCCEEPSNVALSSFTEDIWLEIFSHLPLKFIFKFKCVSKVWFVLLSDPYFVNRWITLNNSNTSSLPWTSFYGFEPPEDYLPDNPMINWFSNAYLELHSPFFSGHTGFTFEFLNPEFNYPDSRLDQGKEHLYLLGSSNGLVLCSTELSVFDYYVCNPLTQKWVALPLPPTPGRKVASGFECQVLSSSIISTKYKVVRIPQFEGDSNKFNVEVFSSVLELGEWNIFEVSCPQVITWKKRNFENDLVICHGVLYWMEGNNRILVCDLDNNNTGIGGYQCWLIDLPNYTECRYTGHYIWESEGFFCYASIKGGYNACTFNAWVLDAEEWRFLHKNIDLHDLLLKMVKTLPHDLLAHFYPQLFQQANDFDLLRSVLSTNVQPLGFIPGDKNIVLVGYWSYVWAFNIQTNEFEELCRPPFLNGIIPSENYTFLPMVHKMMPTILPLPSWVNKKSWLSSSGNIGDKKL